MSPMLKRSVDGMNRDLEELDRVRRSLAPGLIAFNASSPRRIASSLSNSVTPRPLPVSRLTSISIFAPSSPGGVSPATSLRTMLDRFIDPGGVALECRNACVHGVSLVEGRLRNTLRRA